MNPWGPWAMYFSVWAAILPGEDSLPREAVSLQTEDYLIQELRDDLELMGVQGIIDEAGR
jgi:hypothetical protein